MRLLVVRRLRALHGWDRPADGDPADRADPVSPAAATAVYLHRRRDPGVDGAGATGIRQALCAATYETLIGLLAATGMRISEAIKLDRTDIDWAEGVLLVRVSKFNKSRYVPLHATVLDALGRYASRRDD